MPPVPPGNRTPHCPAPPTPHGVRAEWGPRRHLSFAMASSVGSDFLSEARHVTGPQKLQQPGRLRSSTSVCGSLPHNVVPGTVMTWEGMGTVGIGWVEAGIPQHRTAPLPPTKNHPAQDTNSAKAEKLWSPYGSIAPRDVRVPLAGSRALARCKEDAPTVASMQTKFALAPRGAQTPSPGHQRLWGEGGETCSSAGKLEGIREQTAPLSDQLPQTGALPRSWLHLPSPPSVLLLSALGLWDVRL